VTGAELLPGRIVVVSPHLDDAVLSLGAAIARASRSEADVRVLTVLAGDPDSERPAGPWDALSGFSTEGEAATQRRVEDSRACEIVGATPVWLPFSDVENRDDFDQEAVWRAMEAHVADCDLVLSPGFPLHHPDHVLLTTLILRRLDTDRQLALYVEQPYANLAAIPRGYRPRALLTAARIALREGGARRLLRPTLPAEISGIVPGPVEWLAARATSADRRLKAAAIRAYESQLVDMRRRLVDRIRIYERGWGGEGVALLERR
jgi:LmbE family N-acetylglucosaminyl deacetylase